MGVDGVGSEERRTETAVTQVGFDPVMPELAGLEFVYTVFKFSCFHETWKSGQFCRGVLTNHPQVQTDDSIILPQHTFARRIIGLFY